MESFHCSAKVHVILEDMQLHSFADGVQVVDTIHSKKCLITWVKQPFPITSRNIEGDKLLIVGKIILQYL